ncbi:MAG: glycogen/starch/alpha-glucan phosphorylase, partial [Clostridia bacterium]|nr:glycogen/starch/alpha-glucan phosphorylase [Clostridia bacterium]
SPPRKCAAAQAFPAPQSTVRGRRAQWWFITTATITSLIHNYLTFGFAGESFADIASYLLGGHGVADPYMCLADFESYRVTHEDMIRAYADKETWNRMSLLNIAAAGHFAADRSIEEYAQRIWNLKKVTN